MKIYRLSAEGNVTMVTQGTHKVVEEVINVVGNGMERDPKRASGDIMQCVVNSKLILFHVLRTCLHTVYAVAVKSWIVYRAHVCAVLAILEMPVAAIVGR